MGYLLTEIVVYLVIAALIGFAFGWAVRDGVLDKYFDKFIGLVKKIWTGFKAIIKTLVEGLKKYFDKLIELIKKVWTVIKGFFANLKSSKTKETVKSDTGNNEKFCLITKVKELWSTYYLTLTTSKKVEKETTEDVKETAAEVIKEETKVEEIVETKEVELEVPTAEEETSSPVLFSEAPETGADKLSSIKGIGPVLEKKLNVLGVYSFEQIASWDTAQELWIGTQMAFPKRVTKEEWVKQAKELLNK